MKLWHDDNRRAPDESWTVARTNEEALRLLAEEDVEEASLDYQLTFPENGMELVDAMIERECIPPKVNIHSWSGLAYAMADALRDAGCPNVTVKAASW